MKQKVLFFDIDGTLIWSYGGIQEIPQGVQKELKRLKEQGHKLFICSGRPKAMLDQKWWDGTFDGYVLNNGGYVEIDGKSIYENRMDYELCLKTANMLEELHCDYMIATANHLYIDPSYKELYNFFVQNGHFEDLFTTKFDRNEVLKRAIKIEANVTNKDREKIEIISKMILVMLLILMNMAVIMLLNFIHQQFQKQQVFKKFLIIII